MRTLFVSLCILMTQIICSAQNSIFNHSDGDGFSSLSFFETNCSNGIFNHGAGDGFDSEGVLESIAGGSSIFSHGMGDGFHVAHYRQNALAMNNNIFNHTEGDGFSNTSFTQSGALSNNPIFTHGGGDGFSFAALTQSLAKKGGGARLPTEETIAGETTEKFLVFPNPSTGKLTLQLEQVELNEKRIRLINQFGVVVFDQQCVARTTELRLESLAKGVYLMYVFDSKNTFSQRIVLY